MTQLYKITMEFGWNLVNSGGYTNSFNELTDNSDNIELIYDFENGNYQLIDKQTNLTQGKSYWVFCTETVILTHDLGKNGENILEIYEGWNLIACPRNSSMFLSDIFDTNIDTVNAVVKWEDGNYVNIDLNNDPLEPGVGYWVLVSRAFTIEVTWFLKRDKIYGNSTSIPLGNKIFATKNVFYSNSGTEENMYFFDNTTLSKRRFSPAGVDPDELPMPPPYIFNTNKDVEYLLIFSKPTSNVKYVYFIKYISTGNSLDRYKFRLPTAFKQFGDNDIIVFGRGYGINTPEPPDARLVRSDAEEGEVYVYDFKQSFNRYELTITIKFTNAESLAITPDGNVLAIGNKQNICIHNISDGAVVEANLGCEISLNDDVNTMNMALSGNGKTIAFTENGTSVHVYHNTLDNDKNWVELGAGDLDHEGLSVDIDHEGTTVVFGAPDIERIYIDEWNGNGWITSHINGISLNLSNSFKFGTSISLNNNLIAVGSPQRDVRYTTGPENDAGEIHIFEKKGYVKDDSLYKNRFSFDYLEEGDEINLSSQQTFTAIKRDLLRTNILLKASRQWSELIKSMPDEEHSETDRKITINVGFFTDDSSNCTEGTCIGGAAAFNDTIRDTTFNNYFNNYTLNGFIYLNNTLQYSKLQYTAGHEIGHVLGIGGMWRDDYCKDTLKEQQQDDDNSIERNYYKGQNALNVYKWYNATGEPYSVDGIDTNYTNSQFSDATNYIGIPIEQDGGPGTAEGHLEEGNDLGGVGNIITSDGLDYCGLRNEIMTGISSSSDIISAITVGLLADLGYGVNWEKSQPFDLNQTTNRNSNGKDFLKMKCSNGHCHLNEIVRNKQVKVLEFKSK